MPILPDVSENTNGKRKGGGRPPARAAEFHNVSIRLSPVEHQMFRAAVGFSGIAGGGGAFVAMLTRDYLRRNGVRINGDTEQEDHT